MRKIQQAQPIEQNAYQPPTLRITKNAAIYARRSDKDAKSKETDNSQSREMQTEDLLAWGMKQGWKQERLEPYFADLGLSGTLRPDQRKDMLRLYIDIEKGIYNHGMIICYQESGLFRDQTQVYYNEFIQICLKHDILVVATSPYTIIYDFKDEFLADMFRWKCKEAGDFIKRHVKGWMLPARERAAKEGKWSGLGSTPIGYVVDMNPTSKTYKRFVSYELHAKSELTPKIRPY